MKKKFLFLLAVLPIITLCSCGSDDPEPEPNPIVDTNLIYMEPCLNWGCSQSTVKTFMNGYSLLKETATLLQYDGKYKEEYTTYSFDNSAYKSVLVAIRTSKVASEDIANFLNERYSYAAYDDDTEIFLFYTKDKKTAIGLSVRTYNSVNYWAVIYMKNSASSIKQGILNVKRMVEEQDIPVMSCIDDD